jgi:hypothetical protein
MKIFKGKKKWGGRTHKKNKKLEIFKKSGRTFDPPRPAAVAPQIQTTLSIPMPLNRYMVVLALVLHCVTNKSARILLTETTKIFR